MELTITLEKTKAHDHIIGEESKEEFYVDMSNSRSVESFMSDAVTPIIDELDEEQQDYYFEEINLFGLIVQGELEDDHFDSDGEILASFELGDFNYTFTVRRDEE